MKTGEEIEVKGGAKEDPLCLLLANYAEQQQNLMRYLLCHALSLYALCTCSNMVTTTVYPAIAFLVFTLKHLKLSSILLSCSVCALRLSSWAAC